MVPGRDISKVRTALRLPAVCVAAECGWRLSRLTKLCGDSCKQVVSSGGGKLFEGEVKSKHGAVAKAGHTYPVVLQANNRLHDEERVRYVLLTLGPCLKDLHDTEERTAVEAADILLHCAYTTLFEAFWTLTFREEADP
jgi:hypothetical protein